jgi:hypothetical protein
MGEAGPKGEAGSAAAKPVFSLRKFTGEAGKAIDGKCEMGEQMIAVNCSTSATVSDDNMGATCAAPAGQQPPAQLTLTCVK